MSRQMKVALNLLTSMENPDIATVGDIYFNVVSKNLRIYNGMDWVELTPPSTDPTPFYMHTHSFDGDVHTIDVQNKITFKETNTSDSPDLVLPLVIGYNGQTPSSLNDGGTFENQTLIDGGDPEGNVLVVQEEVLEGGSSTDNSGIIVDGEGSSSSDPEGSLMSLQGEILQGGNSADNDGIIVNAGGS